MPADASFRTSADVLGDRTSPIPRQRGAADHPPRDAAPVPSPELVERLAQELYNGLDPRFVDWEWQDATEGAREWARGRARRLLAERMAGAGQPSGGDSG